MWVVPCNTAVVVVHENSHGLFEGDVHVGLDTSYGGAALSLATAKGVDDAVVLFALIPTSTVRRIPSPRIRHRDDP